MSDKKNADKEKIDKMTKIKKEEIRVKLEN